jgi:hypothetical protein
MTKPITPSAEDLARTELLDAIRKQASNAATQVPSVGALALRNLAEAYATVTAEPLGFLSSQVGEPAE